MNVLLAWTLPRRCQHTHAKSFDSSISTDLSNNKETLSKAELVGDHVCAMPVGFVRYGVLPNQ